jgi:hypothetical protein
MRRAVVVGCASVAAVGAIACGGSNDRPRERVDEHAGRFRDVAIGNRAAEVRRKLGPPQPHDPEKPLPSGESIIPVLSADGDDPGMAYDGAFYAIKDGRVSAIIAYGDDAATTDGVRIGDSLDDAEKAYRDADCHDAEPLADPSRDAYCEVRTAPSLWLWLGGDPVDNIVVSIVPPSG